MTSQDAVLWHHFPGVVAFDGEGRVMALLSAIEIDAGVAETGSPAPASGNIPVAI